MNFSEIEKKRQNQRTSEQIYATAENPNKPKFYVLDMFPYPSGAGLHVGHPKGYIASDILTRKKMLEGFSVLHPMGFDTFWLGTEQYAIDHKMKPQKVAQQNIETFKKQLAKMGFSYDWKRSFSTADPEYYKRTQRVFLQMYNSRYDEKAGKARPISEYTPRKTGAFQSEQEEINAQRLAYIDYKPINRCPHCKTGLANEDLEDGKCERCGNEVEQRPMKQRVLRITKYAERLLSGLEHLNRDENMKELERNWIGKSSGTEFKMQVKTEKESWNVPTFSVFTTRVDTVFWMTFVVMAPEHELVDHITTDEYREAVENYKIQAKHKTQLERTELQKEKTWQFTGAYAINPFNGKEVPIFIGDYVLANYGTGVVMAVPAHDERDFEFAKKHKLEIIQSIKPLNYQDANEKEIKDWIYNFEELEQLPEIATQKGLLINSHEFDNLTSDKAIPAMQKWLSEQNLWGEKCNYKIQDRVFSRQRYRGEPFPVVFCEQDGIVPLNESDLPLLLPDVENYEPTGREEWPLADIHDRINTTCPKCGKPAKRESNTMPGWAGSSRYRLRYMDPKNSQKLVSKEKEQYRKNVDVYIGGAEHVTRHMIYARFWQKFLFDIGVVSQDEPFQRYEKVWLIMAEDGRKMSKRRGNVVNPDEIIAKYGADAFRMYEMFMGPFDQFIARNTNGLKGVRKFIDKIVALRDKVNEGVATPKNIEILLHQTIKKTTEDIDAFRFNTCISQFMILINQLSELEKIDKKLFETIIILLAPFAPHLAEEFWSKLGNEFSIFTKAQRPTRDETKLVADEIKIAVQFNGKVRWTINISANANQDEVMKKIQEQFQNYFSNWEVKKIIYIPGKIANIVIG